MDRLLGILLVLAIRIGFGRGATAPGLVPGLGRSPAEGSLQAISGDAGHLTHGQSPNSPRSADCPRRLRVTFRDALGQTPMHACQLAHDPRPRPPAGQ